MKVSQWQKMSKTLKVSSSAVTKTIKRYDKTGSHEDHHRKGRPRVTSAAEDKLIRVTSLRNCSPNKCFTEFK
jgi:transposase